MKNGQAARRSRGRSNSRPNNTGQRYGDQNRNEQRVRGNPSQLVEKYKSLAKDALSSGDRVLAENYFQHADHFLRLINDRQGAKPADTSDGKEASGSDSSSRRPKKQRRHSDDPQAPKEVTAGAQAENAEEASVKEQSTSDDVPVEKKVRRTRRPRKADAESTGAEVNGSPEDAAVTEVMVEEKPKRKRRSVKKVEDAAAGEEKAAE